MSELSTNSFEAPVILGGKKIRGRFVIPSGIRCTRAATIQWCFSCVPSVGVVTTKSISFPPRAGYREPIYARYAPESYINAVGLSNPGAEAFRKELEGVAVPGDKFLLVSIFGGNVEQFVKTAQELKPVADGFELNMSCPHAEGYGVEIGQNRGLVAQITEAVVRATGLPVIVKLSAVVGDVGLTSKAAIEAGAAGITVSNTIGPATVNLGGAPILSNKVGGLSGTAIQPLGLRSIKRVRDAIGPESVLIGMGGVARPDDVRQFLAAGANLVGVGSALTGMDSAQMQEYFEKLHAACVQPASTPAAPATTVELPRIDMDYFPTRLAGREFYHASLYKIVLESLPVAGTPGELGGRYFFLFIPGVGEKPFAIFSAEEKSVVIRIVGKFTQALAELPIGAPIYLRGPYGRVLPDAGGRQIVLVGGGTGIASVFEIGRRHQYRGRNQLVFLLGGRSSKDLFDLEKFSAIGMVRTATDDGSAGHHGFVSDLLTDWVSTAPPARENSGPLYVLCGPELMVHACFKVLSNSTATQPEDIWASIEYMTSCGVGICGKCASPAGHLTCIDGPFLPQPAFTSCLRREAPTC